MNFSIVRYVQALLGALCDLPVWVADAEESGAPHEPDLCPVRFNPKRDDRRGTGYCQSEACDH
jgi:hypothetical protein